MERSATAIWQGGVKSGTGKLTTESGVLFHTPYSFFSRFESEKETNPEELIAAAHAGCFTMDLSGRLEHAGMTAENIQTKAVVTLNKGEKGFAVTCISLEVKAKIANPDEAIFQAAVKKAKENCPVSRLLNTEITVIAKMEA